MSYNIYYGGENMENQPMIATIRDSGTTMQISLNRKKLLAKGITKGDQVFVIVEKLPPYKQWMSQNEQADKDLEPSKPYQKDYTTFRHLLPDLKNNQEISPFGNITEV